MGSVSACHPSGPGSIPTTSQSFFHIKKSTFYTIIRSLNGCWWIVMNCEVDWGGRELLNVGSDSGESIAERDVTGTASAEHGEGGRIARSRQLEVGGCLVHGPCRWIDPRSLYRIDRKRIGKRQEIFGSIQAVENVFEGGRSGAGQTLPRVLAEPAVVVALERVQLIRDGGRRPALVDRRPGCCTAIGKYRSWRRKRWNRRSRRDGRIGRNGRGFHRGIVQSWVRAVEECASMFGFLVRFRWSCTGTGFHLAGGSFRAAGKTLLIGQFFCWVGKKRLIVIKAIFFCGFKSKLRFDQGQRSVILSCYIQVWFLNVKI